MKRRIVDRYLLAECAKTWLGVTAVLLILTLGVGFARFIGRAAAGELSAETVFTIAAISGMENLEIVFPASMLLAVMLTVGRLCQDNEMTALAAGGYGLWRLYRPFLMLAALLAAVSAVLSLVVSPMSGRIMAEMRTQSDVAAALTGFEAGRFRTLMGGRAVFYAHRVDHEAGRMRDVFIRVLRKPEGAEEAEEIVVSAATALRQPGDDGGQTLILRDGWRYEGQPGRADYRRVRFAEHGVHIDPPVPDYEVDLGETETTTLLTRNDLESRAELQERVSVPVSLVLLTLLALPLGYLPPRSGRYGRLVLGVLVFVAYSHVLRLAKVWMSDGVVPAYLGLWWVHAGMLAAAMTLVAYRQGGLRWFR